MAALPEYLTHAFLQIFDAPLNVLSRAHSRNYWIFMLSGVGIVALAALYRREGRAFAAAFFSRHAWWSPSARDDYKLLIVSPVVFFLCFQWLFDLLARLGPAMASQPEAGPPPAGSGQWVMGGLLTVSLFLVNDFLRWLTHWLQHRVPVLWEFHKIHHSAEVLNFATAERFHPVDRLVSAVPFALAAILVNSLFTGLHGGRLDLWTLFGANGLWVVANLAGGTLRHSPAWLSFGPGLERWFISPAMHKIHHSDNPAHFDKNFGGALAIWDRMSGTLFVPDGRLALTYGLGAESAAFRGLAALYGRPFIVLWRRWRPAGPRDRRDRAGRMATCKR